MKRFFTVAGILSALILAGAELDNGGLNVLFGDGHVDLLKRGDIPDEGKTPGVKKGAFYYSLNKTGSWYVE